MKKNKIMVVDDTESDVDILVYALSGEYEVSVARSGAAALKAVGSDNLDLMLLDIVMPGMDGYEVCRRIRESPSSSGIPVIFITGMESVECKTKGFELGAVDYITKPFDVMELKARVRTHIELKSAREFLKDRNAVLDEMVTQRTAELRRTQAELKQSYLDTIHKLAVVAEYKDEETSSHIIRVGLFCKMLAGAMGWGEKEAEIISYAAPMHDIGKVGIPSDILLKTGRLNAEEFSLMKTHTVIGERILTGSASRLLRMAASIAQSHHEAWDGSGYPRGVVGGVIPVEARFMKISDQYDALRSVRPYKLPFNHEKTIGIISKGDGRTMPAHFDPKVLEAFMDLHKTFEEIYEGEQEL